jgi:hypothetical protein
MQALPTGAILAVWVLVFRTGPGQWLAEAVATFGLLLIIFGCVSRRPDSVAYAVGLYITAAYLFTASTSFANPAVTIARSLPSPGPPRGNRNAWKHGRYSAEAIARRKSIAELIRISATIRGYVILLRKVDEAFDTHSFAFKAEVPAAPRRSNRRRQRARSRR